MWQRFQTLLLIICALLIASLWWTDMCVAVDSFAEDGTPLLETIKFTDYLPFLIMSIVCFSLTISAICYFSHRIIQIRLCIMQLLIQIGFQAWIVFEFFKLKVAYAFKIPALFPLVCIILLLLAIKYIWRDEAMMIANGYIVRGKKNRHNRKHRIAAGQQ